MRVTLCRPQEAQIDVALADHAVVKLRRGPTCTYRQNLLSLASSLEARQARQLRPKRQSPQ